MTNKCLYQLVNELNKGTKLPKDECRKCPYDEYGIMIIGRTHDVKCDRYIKISYKEFGEKSR